MIPTLRVRLGPVRLLSSQRILIFAGILVATLLALACFAMTIGTMPLPVSQLGAALLHRSSERTNSIVWAIRLPRVVTAIAVGMALGAAGCVFQSMSRNALGSPDIIGFTTGAATGAIIAIVFAGASHSVTSLSAVGSGLLTAVLVYGLARQRRATGTYRLILVGIGVSAMLSALNTLILAKGNIELAIKARLWLSGSLTARQWADAVPVVIGLAVGLPVLMSLARRLEILDLGDDQAQQLGISPDRLRLAIMVTGVALTALAVSAAGPITFIALAAPHITHRLVRDARIHVLCSAGLGAALLLVADIVSQSLPVSIGLPVGLVTGTIGGCYLLWILMKEKSL